MSKLGIAITAFLTIVSGKDHIYSDDTINSISGTVKVVGGFILDIDDLYEDSINQVELIREAKRLINAK